jgi:hypothetical protein
MTSRETTFPAAPALPRVLCVPTTVCIVLRDWVHSTVARTPPGSALSCHLPLPLCSGSCRTTGTCARARAGHFAGQCRRASSLMRLDHTNPHVPGSNAC